MTRALPSTDFSAIYGKPCSICTNMFSAASGLLYCRAQEATKTALNIVQTIKAAKRITVHAGRNLVSDAHYVQA
eukprot:6176107-Pleurochrysis_carterae.AAC.3